MGRSIKKKYFSAKAGSEIGDITVTTTAGSEVIINQKGTGVYTVNSGRIKLRDGAPSVAAGNGVTGDARLQHNDGTNGLRNVRKLSQYRVHYFSDGNAATEDSSVWRDKNGNAIGTFSPALTVDGLLTALLSGLANNGIVAITISDAGAGYSSAPTITIEAPNGSDATASTVAQTGGVPDSDQSSQITAAGDGYSSVPAVSTTGGAGSGATFTATLTNGQVTGISASGGTGYNGSETFVIGGITQVQATATATIDVSGTVNSITLTDAGDGYAAGTVTATVSAP